MSGSIKFVVIAATAAFASLPLALPQAANAQVGIYIGRPSRNTRSRRSSRRAAAPGAIATATAFPTPSTSQQQQPPSRRHGRPGP